MVEPVETVGRGSIWQCRGSLEAAAAERTGMKRWDWSGYNSSSMVPVAVSGGPCCLMDGPLVGEPLCTSLCLK